MPNRNTDGADANSGGSTAERATEAQPAAAAPALTPAAKDGRIAALSAERDEMTARTRSGRSEPLEPEKLAARRERGYLARTT